MKINSMNQQYYLLLAVFICGLIYTSYLWLRPVEIIDIHQDENWSDVIVNNFPVTKSEKISWWNKNKTFLHSKYSVPAPDKNGYFHVTFWDIGSGYKADTGTDQDSDLLCFDDMKTNANCIEKNKVFEVLRGRNGGLQYR
ncbi:hypothetical protein VA7868_03653 [Vibrio aerogenes CECT 7868]|uniref:Uncharacterized protein n=1 Tax=Vibrio aerogenes CECT 7868 TaxID=1216006 RepID=A0A1M6AS76_9VIBR|nr:DUF943 family protein [Vibrio aerogenes]SHI39322.1 hypothetical protein VA7868_03653 [Vibrio aerogenes CECT 7868]